MESLDKAMARESQVRKYQKTTVRSLNDIKRVVAEFNPQMNRAKEDTTTFTRFEGTVLATNTHARSKRDIIVDGLLAIKKPVESPSEAQSTSPLLKVKTAAFEGSGVDNLIAEWFDAFRVGQLICWKIDGSTYKYDIFQHKLTKSDA